jgi:hypothetical protein
VQCTEKKAEGGQIGSDAWLGADVYEADDEFNVQTAKCFDQVKWDVLASIASHHRDGGC